MAQDVRLRVCACSYLEASQEILTARAAAIASNLALGFDVPQAVRAANRYVEAAIRESRGLGKGAGPINHFHSSYMLPFAP